MLLHLRRAALLDPRVQRHAPRARRFSASASAAHGAARPRWHWDGQPLHELLCDRHDPTAAALVFQDGDAPPRPVTYGELADRSRRLAKSLRDMGVARGDRVGVMLPKIPELYVVAVALARLGACYLPLFTAFGPGAVQDRVEASGLKVLITTQEHRHKFCAVDRGRAVVTVTGASGVEAADRDFGGCEAGAVLSPGEHATSSAGDELLALLFTSGTTGNPKGVPVPARALLNFAIYLREGLGVHRDAVFWNVADPGWAYGLYYNVYGPLYMGHTAHALNAPFSPQATIDFMAERGVTHFAAAPTVYRGLRAAAPQVDPAMFRLQAASSAGEPLPVAVGRWFESRFGVPIFDHYGQTENGMTCVHHHVGPRARDRARAPDMSMGVPLRGFDLAVLGDDGVEVANDGVMGHLAIDVGESPGFWFPGYWRRGDPVADARGYYMTGDRACFWTVDGERVFVSGGRSDDVITAAGYRIDPTEVEERIMQLGFVAEVGVVGLADELKGEAVAAFVVLTDAARAAADERRLRQSVFDHVRGLAKHLAPRPDHVFFTADLPKTESGKIRRNVLRSRCD